MIKQPDEQWIKQLLERKLRKSDDSEENNIRPLWLNFIKLSISKSTETNGPLKHHGGGSICINWAAAAGGGKTPLKIEINNSLIYRFYILLWIKNNNNVIIFYW